MAFLEACKQQRATLAHSPAEDGDAQPELDTMAEHTLPEEGAGEFSADESCESKIMHNRHRLFLSPAVTFSLPVFGIPTDTEIHTE